MFGLHAEPSWLALISAALLIAYPLGMPRAARLDAPLALQHVWNRGIERRPIVLDDADRLDFLTRIAPLVQAAHFAVYAWALMTNHFHPGAWGGVLSRCLSRRTAGASGRAAPRGPPIHSPAQCGSRRTSPQSTWLHAKRSPTRRAAPDLNLTVTSVCQPPPRIARIATTSLFFSPQRKDQHTTDTRDEGGRLKPRGAWPKTRRARV